MTTASRLDRGKRRRFAAGIITAVCAAGGGADASELDVSGGVTVILQAADDSTVDDELTASADLFFTLPRANGEWLLYIEGATTPDASGISSLYPTANADAGSVLNRDGDGGLQISEFSYTFRFDEDHSLMLGLVNPSAWLDRSRITNDENNHFINGSFKNNATIEFPDYTMGAIYRRSGSKLRPELVVIAASSDGISDLPDRSYQDLLNLTSDERGAFLGAGASWLRESTSLRLGAWLRTDDHDVAGRPGETEQNYGTYAVLGWQDGINALNFRTGIANADVSIATKFVAAAFQRQTVAGLLGIGIGRTFVAQQHRQAALEHTTDAELFLRIPVGDSAGHVTPSLQYVDSPGLGTDGAGPSSSATVASVRFHWSF